LDIGEYLAMEETATKVSKSYNIAIRKGRFLLQSKRWAAILPEFGCPNQRYGLQ
jgi:hypothetical protein